MTMRPLSIVGFVVCSFVVSGASHGSDKAVAILDRAAEMPRRFRSIEFQTSQELAIGRAEFDARIPKRIRNHYAFACEGKRFRMDESPHDSVPTRFSFDGGYYYCLGSSLRTYSRSATPRGELQEFHLFPHPIAQAYLWLFARGDRVAMHVLADPETWNRLKAKPSCTYLGERNDHGTLREVVQFENEPSPESRLSVEVEFAPRLEYLPVRWSSYRLPARSLLKEVRVSRTITRTTASGERFCIPVEVEVRSNDLVSSTGTYAIEEASIRVNEPIDDDQFTLSPFGAEVLLDHVEGAMFHDPRGEAQEAPQLAPEETLRFGTTPGVLKSGSSRTRLAWLLVAVNCLVFLVAWLWSNRGPMVHRGGFARQRYGRAALAVALTSAASFGLWHALAPGRSSNDDAPLQIGGGNVIEIGTVVAGGRARRAIEVQNTGPAEIVVTSIRSGCDCVEAHLDPSTITPGQRAILWIDAKGTNPGQSIEQPLWINTNASAKPLIPLTVRFDVASGAHPQTPGFADFGRIDRDALPYAITVPGPLLNNAERTPEVRCDVADETFVEATARSDEGDTEISVRLLEKAPSGDSVVKVRIGDPARKPAHEIYVTASVRGAFYAKPTHLFLAAEPRREPAPAIVQIRNRDPDARPVRLEAVRLAPSLSGWIRATPIETADLIGFQLSRTDQPLDFSKTFPSRIVGWARALIALHDGEGFEEVNVPVELHLFPEGRPAPRRVALAIRK